MCVVCVWLQMQIKLAYEAILQHEAGYRPPPPGSAPNAQYAEAYWHAHTADGRVPWGQFAGGWACGMWHTCTLLLYDGMHLRVLLCRRDSVIV